MTKETLETVLKTLAVRKRQPEEQIELWSGREDVISRKNRALLMAAFREELSQIEKVQHYRANKHVLNEIPGKENT